MTPIDWRDVPLTKEHDRSGFDCGDVELNTWLVRYALQSHTNGSAKTFVATSESAPNRILAFCSLSPASIEYSRTPLIVTRGLGRYEVPVFRLARLAVDLSFQRRGLGRAMLVAAGERCSAVAAQVGGVGMLIDAKNEAVAKWYAIFGAVPLLDTPLSLILPFDTFRRSLRNPN